MKTESPVFVIDTREQKPYRFPNSIIKTLKTGDYSLEGFEDLITVERKTKGDAYQTFGSGRNRFERELLRMSSFKYSALVIECSMTGFMKAPKFAQMNPRSAMNSVIAWSVKHNIHVFFTCDRLTGNTVTQRLLEKFWKYNK